MAPPKKQVVGPLHLRTRSPEETVELAAAFGRLCQAGDVVCLQGTLGAGKTHFTKGMAEGLGVENTENVTSPTFVLLKKYRGDKLTLNHFDAYRLHGASEMQDIGCEEIFSGGGVSVVEWADRVVECLPEEHFLVTIRIIGTDVRDILLGTSGTGLADRIEEITETLQPWSAGDNA